MRTRGRMHWSWLLVLCLLVLAGCGEQAETNISNEPPAYADDLRGALISPPRPVADFTLASTTGEDFTLSEHQDEVVLMYFGFLNCPDFCPTSMADLRRAYNELGEPAENVKIVFVTVDPERDTIDRMTNYVAAFHDDFIGLRDDGEALQALIDEFGIVAEHREVENSALGYLIDHTVSIFMIAPDGRLLSQFLYGTPYQDIAHDVRLVLEEEGLS